MLTAPLLLAGLLAFVTACAVHAALSARQANALLSAVVHTAVDAIITIDERGRVESFNPAAERLFGYCAAEVIGRNVCMLMPQPYAREHDDYLRRYRRTGERRIIGIGREVAAQRKDGSVFPIELSVGEAHPGRRVFTGIIRDITDRKRAEAEREELLESERAARAEAERAARAKDDFLATVSHELRTPLGAILGWTSMLEGDPSPAMQKRTIEVVQRNTRALARMVEDLLDISRVAYGKLRIEPRPLDLREVIDAAAAALTPAAAAKRIRLEKHLGAPPTLVHGDPGRLQQVLWNLVSNAVKFTPDGGSVRVALAVEADRATISVSDTGRGIPAELLPHVFERFKQGEAGTARAHTGLGLGLALARQLVELHGGSVCAESSGEGRGATFTVSLPLAEAGGSSAADCSAVLAGVKVLVVDDEEDARDLVRRTLERCHVVVATAASADEALASIEAHPPDVLLSDIGMPNRDGYQLARALRALDADHGGNTPAAALTAYARPEDRQRALEAGYQVHLAKPVDAADLVRTVAELSGRKAA
jgi:PAS domain S-box-containing protein